ncbi:hypothetical protein SADUNF_Sadunf12G0097900 [Salix dunnii]|uniref:Uncharacterized protein n=1 Tax=Salix dunnii TaxID=1413687 RepID=A0A835JNX8_9ROSI|nr:hypothetical protein SADUNF_Sadunf12G0097900 [Salix dunnii]
MDLATEELQFLTIPEILKESISIPKQSPKTFQLITVALIFPLSFAILAHSLFTHPLLDQIQDDPSSQNTHQWTLLLVFQFFYLIFLFAFSLLSTAAVVFTVASLYTSKPVSFSSTTSAIPQVFKRIDIQNTLLVLFSLMVIGVLYLVVHVYITALWHLASVVSVLEPVYGLVAMKKSYELLKGKIRVAVYLNRIATESKRSCTTEIHSTILIEYPVRVLTSSPPLGTVASLHL